MAYIMIEYLNSFCTQLLIVGKMPIIFSELNGSSFGQLFSSDFESVFLSRQLKSNKNFDLRLFIL